MILNFVMKKEDKKMNIVIMFGKIVSNIEFKFIYNRYTKNWGMEHKTSIVKCKIELANGSIVEVYGYDEIADFMYRNLKNDANICIQGRLDSNGKVEIQEFM